MSASREKKIRQELAAQGIPDIKQIRAAEEKKQQRRANWLYGSVAVIFVVVAAALVVWNSQIIQRSSNAVTVGDETFSAAEVEYYYYAALNSVTGSTYASYMSLDTSLPLTQQVMTDNDYLFLGIEQEEGVEQTWHEFFIERAKTSLIQLASLLQGAKEEDFGFTDEMQADIDDTMAMLDSYATQYGMTTLSYIKAVFGDTMTMKVMDKLIRENTLAAFYEQSKIDALTYTDDEIEAYYAENKDSFDVASGEYIYFKGTASSTVDADGNTVSATEEEQNAAKEAAKEAAEDALERYNAGETDVEALASLYSIASYYSEDQVTMYGDVISTWLFDAERKEGDAAVLESGSNYYLVRFNSRGRLEYNTVDARHILVQLDTSGLDSSAEDYQTKLDALKTEAEAEAERILAEWKAGAATAESFGELANTESDDGGSNTTGGLYTQIYKGQMVSAFEDWCFDESRKEGDTGIVFVESTNYSGYHIMYFQGINEPYWKLVVRSAMSDADYSAWAESMMEGLEAKELGGMKYVG